MRTISICVILIWPKNKEVAYSASLGSWLYHYLGSESASAESNSTSSDYNISPADSDSKSAESDIKSADTNSKSDVESDIKVDSGEPNIADGVESMDELFEPSGNPGDYADDGGIQVKNRRIHNCVSVNN